MPQSKCSQIRTPMSNFVSTSVPKISTDKTSPATAHAWANALPTTSLTMLTWSVSPHARVEATRMWMGPASQPVPVGSMLTLPCVFAIPPVRVAILEMSSIISVLCSVLRDILEILQEDISVLKLALSWLSMPTQSLVFVWSRQAAHHPISMLTISPGNVLHSALKVNQLMEILQLTIVTLPVHGLQVHTISKIPQLKHVYRPAQLTLLILQTTQLRAVYWPAPALTTQSLVLEHAKLHVPIISIKTMLPEYVFQPVLSIPLSHITMLPIVPPHNVWQSAQECFLLIPQLFPASTLCVPVFPHSLLLTTPVLVLALLPTTHTLWVEYARLLVMVHIWWITQLGDALQYALPTLVCLQIGQPISVCRTVQQTTLLITRLDNACKHATKQSDTWLILRSDSVFWFAQTILIPMLEHVYPLVQTYLPSTSSIPLLKVV